MLATFTFTSKKLRLRQKCRRSRPHSPRTDSHDQTGTYMQFLIAFHTVECLKSEEYRRIPINTIWACAIFMMLALSRFSFIRDFRIRFCWYFCMMHALSLLRMIIYFGIIFSGIILPYLMIFRPYEAMMRMQYRDTLAFGADRWFSLLCELFLLDEHFKTWWLLMLMAWFDACRYHFDHASFLSFTILSDSKYIYFDEVL